MEIKHLTLAEADALGLPRVTYVIHSGAVARRFVARRAIVGSRSRNRR